MKSINSTFLKVKTSIILLVFLFVLFTSNAQRKWNLTFRPSLDFHTEDLGDANLGIGWGPEIAIDYRFQPYFSTYAGFSLNTFPAEESFAGKNVTFKDYGFCFGMRYNHPIPNWELDYFIGVGGNYNQIAGQNSHSNTILSTDFGLGWQVEGGFSYLFGERFHFIPSIRYRSSSKEITIGNTITPFNFNYFSINGAISWSF